jgi:hypothetical protein
MFILMNRILPRSIQFFPSQFYFIFKKIEKISTFLKVYIISAKAARWPSAVLHLVKPLCDCWVKDPTKRFKPIRSDEWSKMKDPSLNPKIPPY